MREKRGYRDTLEQLNKMFPDHGCLNQKEVAMFLGVHRTTVARLGIEFNPVTNRITKADLARIVCN